MEEKSKIINPVSFDPDLIGKKSIIFSVPGKPFGKQRPRAVLRGRFVTIYTPNETKNYEKKVIESYKKSYKNDYYKGDQLTGALTVKIEGIFEVPSGTSKKQSELMLSGEIPHIKKPDCDNMGKVCLDGLNNVAYKDDASIDNLIISKRYGEEAMVKITIIQN